MTSFRLISATAVVLAVLLLSACTMAPTKQKPEPSAAVDPVKPVVPEVVNFTPFPGGLLTCSGQCSTIAGQDFYTWNIKLTFDIDGYGNLSVSQQQEPALTGQDDPAQDAICGTKGSTGNQRNSWLPYTGIFVRGGELLSIHDAERKQQKLLALSDIEGGRMKVVGQNACKQEWYFVPCVGPHRVASGFRLDSFLPRDAMLTIKSANGNLMELSLPSPTEPYVLLRYRSGAMIPVPMRPVLVTVDIDGGRLVAYYQTTFAVAPSLRKIELRAILPNQKPSEGETWDRFRDRSEAMLGELRGCPLPLKPIEECATPNRKPDLRIFSL
jgi:hypothetical protein